MEQSQTIPQPKKTYEELELELETYKNLEEFYKYREDLLKRFIYLSCNDLYKNFISKKESDKIKAYAYFKEILDRSIRDDESFIKFDVNDILQKVVFL
ncbi:MAG: hypothetical protein NZZ41_04010 [Candidatus Dojkabacteria bacterium]|nr:hypothetical protein [Candidatus Dojkabacteria bacterium]